MPSIKQLGDIDSNQSFYDPLEKERPKTKLLEGNYYGNITDMKLSKGITIRSKYSADIYNLTITVHKDNSNAKYKTKDGEEDGEQFIGREIKSNGVFNFLVPSNGDFEANPGGNESFFKFCQALDIKVPTKTIKSDDGDREVHMLPQKLEQSDCLGKPVIVYVGKAKPFVNLEGETITPMKAKFFTKWEEGEKLNLVEDDIPF